jgi:hypothetical protein
VDIRAVSLRVARFPIRTAPAPGQQTFRRIEDLEFLQMSRAYSRHGGLASGDEVACRMRRYFDQPISTLAKWIVKREIVNLVWRSQILVPVFQFTNAGMDLPLAVREVMTELEGVFDDWEIAAWFARPNAFLRNERPVDLVNIDDAGLLQAARADRFVAGG